MSDRKKPRLRRCRMCGDRAEYTRHNKCLNCRVGLMLIRYAKKNKLGAFAKYAL